MSSAEERLKAGLNRLREIAEQIEHLRRLRAHQIETLPVLVDALPLLVGESTRSSLAYSDAVDLLHAQRTGYSQPKNV